MLIFLVAGTVALSILFCSMEKPPLYGEDPRIAEQRQRLIVEREWSIV